MTIKLFTRLLSDQHLFTYVIMCLYSCAVIRYAFARNLFGVCYWTSALCITLTVTFIKKP